MMIEIHDRTQFAVLLEHAERGRPDPLNSLAVPWLSEPIYFNDDVPLGVLRLTGNDGTVHDLRMA